MKSNIFTGPALAAVCIFLFSACSLGLEPAWKGKPTSIAFQLATPDLPESSSYARAIAQGGGYIYIRTLGGPSSSTPYYGPYKVGAGELFETTDLPPGTYDGIGVLYSPESLETKSIGYSGVTTPFATLMQLSDADFDAFSSGGDTSLFNEMLDGDASGFMIKNVTLKTGEVNSFKLTMQPMTGPASTVDTSVLPTINLTSPAPATLVRKFIKIKNVTPTPGYTITNLVATVSATNSPDLGTAALYDQQGKLLQAFPVPASNPITADEAYSVPYTPGDHFFYIEYKAATLAIAFSKVETPITYTVTFDSQGGTAVSPRTGILYNGMTGTFMPTTRAGYTFSNWYTAPSGGGTQFLSSTPVTANLTVYANWMPLSNDADLSALVVNSLPLSPTFVSATLSYTASATSSFPTVSVTPTAVQPGASIRVRINTGAYSAVTSGMPSGTLVLDSPTGVNTIEVEVTAPDLATIRTYTVTINKTVAVTISAGANGSVSPVGTQERTPGAPVALVATPSPGYRFDTWTGTGIVVPTASPSANLTVSAVNSSTTANFVPDFNGGIGTALDPYWVATLAQLKNMNNFRSSFFILTANIDLSSEPNWTPIGDATTKFSGGFDGGGFTLSNLTIDVTDFSTDIGFFGYTDSAVIKNVVLTAIDISHNYNYTGGLIGSATGLTQISDCTVAGVIAGYQGIGGLLGQNDDFGVSTIQDCSTNVSISSSYYGVIGGLVGTTKGGSISRSSATGTIGSHTGGTPSTIGGLVGMNRDTSVTDCYATGNVSGEDSIGGLLGYVDGTSTITNSYSRGLVTAATNGGGFAGQNFATINGCYYDETTSGRSDTGKGVPIVTGSMILQATYSGWNFATVWSIVEGIGYPFLQ